MTKPHQPPVDRHRLRGSALEAAELLAAVERALLVPWHGLPLALVQPGAVADDPADGAPETCYPLGRWGGVVADVRAALDNLCWLGQGTDFDLWQDRNEVAAARQFPDWRLYYGRAYQQPIPVSDLRLNALAAWRSVLGAERMLVGFPESMQSAVLRLRKLSGQLHDISRAPDSVLIEA